MRAHERACVCACSVCMRLQTSGDCSLTTIISDLQSAQPAKAQGHLWTQTFSSFSRHYFILPLCPFCHSLVISRCAFLLVHSPSVSSVFPPLPPLPKPCPPLTLCLLSVNSFFLFLVCWPRLTYFSVSLFQLSLNPPPLTLSLSFCLFGSFPSSLALSGKHKIACICAHTNTYSTLYIHIQRDMHTHTRTHARKDRILESLFP